MLGFPRPAASDSIFKHGVSFSSHGPTLITDLFLPAGSNVNRIAWSPVGSVIIRVITKSDGRAAGVRFLYDECNDYRPNWTTRVLTLSKSTSQTPGPGSSKGG